MSISEQQMAEAVETVQAAVRVVEDAEVPPELKRVAFESAVRLLGGAAPPAEVEEPKASPSRAGPTSATTDVADRVAERLRVDREDVLRVLDFDADGVHVMAPRSRFGRQKSLATQQLAWLVVAARQASGMDPDWTSQQHLREAAEQLGVADPSNFALHMKRLEGVRTRGSGRSGEVRMNAVGYEKAAVLIRQLAGE
ncbi:MAG: hypothetical protein QOF51_1448 [Chloroflexota bacterium]|jgi:hypothetical protein|nr:hypothetical protein [Chloroflexota bacterium]